MARFRGIYWYVEVGKNLKQFIDSGSSRLSRSMELSHSVKILPLQTLCRRFFQGRAMAQCSRGSSGRNYD